MTGPMTPSQAIQLLPPKGRIALYAGAAILGAVLPALQVALVLAIGVVPLWMAVVWSLFSSLTVSFGLIAATNVPAETETPDGYEPRRAADANGL